MNIIYLFVGIVMTIGSLWGGAYIENLLELKDWRAIPVFITCCIIFLIGLIATFAAIDER